MFDLIFQLSHYKKTAYLWRPGALTNSPKPSLSKALLAANWRPQGVRKTSVGKYIDGLGRRKWEGRILWRPESSVRSNGMSMTRELATARAVSDFALVTAQAVTKD
jgi:hypothetical protein